MLQVDAITRRKLVLVKQLYLQALSQSHLSYSVVNRITSIVTFDLAVETLLKVIVASLEQSKGPSDSFPALLDQCDRLLVGQGLVPVPHRAQILHVHGLRNDAQHKARYPNESEINDCRTYTRDVCRDLVASVWNERFDGLSMVDFIDDPGLRDLLTRAQEFLAIGDYAKSTILAENAFHWASLTMFSVIPQSKITIRDTRRGEFGNLVEEINGVVAATARDVTYYAALFSNGISLVSYKRYKDIAPTTYYIGSTEMTASGPIHTRRLQIVWGGRVPNQEDATWLQDFAINAVTNWQSMGLQPRLNDDQKEQADMLKNFGPEVQDLG